MALTPDQKRRIAELDSKPPVPEAEPEEKPKTFLARAKTLWLVARVSRFRQVIGKAIILCIVLAVAFHYVRAYQLHRIDFGAVLSSGPGDPVSRFVRALQLQKEKADMLEKGEGQRLSGDYESAFATAVVVQQMDPKDERARKLIDLLAQAATVRASKEFDEGEIEAALADVRLALDHLPDHKAATDLSLRIASRLLSEAQGHYGKREYAQAITKAQEVIKINPSDVVALNLLKRTNDELLSRASESFINQRYYDALEDVRQSLRIDPSNTDARKLFNLISLHVEVPNVKLRGIIGRGATSYAILQVPQVGNAVYAKEGDVIKNLKVVDIDPEARTVKLLQIHTKGEFTIELPKPQ